MPPVPLFNLLKYCPLPAPGQSLDAPVCLSRSCMAGPAHISAPPMLPTHQATLRFLITMAGTVPQASPTSLPPPPSAWMPSLCVIQSAGHTSLHARQSLPWLCPSPSGPSSPLLCCDVCVHAHLPHGPGGSLKVTSTGSLQAKSGP